MLLILANNRAVGVAAFNEETKLRLVDVVVGNTQSQENDAKWGVGLQVADGAEVEVKEGLLTNNRTFGAAAFYEGTKLRLVDVIVSNTLSQKSNGIAGRGLYVLDGAEVEVSCLFTKNRGSGVTAFNDGTLLTMNDIIISNTLEQQCATELKPSFLRCGIGKVEFETQCPFFRLSRFVFSNLSVARSSKNSRTRHIMRTNMGDEACDAQLARFFCS